MKPFFTTIICLLMAFCVGAAPVEKAEKNKLTWHKDKERVDADIQTWSLDTTLEKIAAGAGWEVYVEPGAAQKVSTKFSNLPVDDALKKMLGKLSFALLPQTNGAPRFYVFQTSMGNATRLVARAAKKAAQLNPDAILDELIVTLKPDAGITIEELAKLVGAKITGRDDKNYTYRLKFESEAATEDAREELLNNIHVAVVDSNYEAHQPPPISRAQLPSIPFSMNPTPKNDPNNLVIGLVDSPVQSMGAAMDSFVLEQLSAAGKSAKIDAPMHGTLMAEAILQAMQKTSDGGQSKVKILPVDVYGERSVTSTYDIGIGIQMAVENGATIINLSLGTYGDNYYLRTQIENLSSKGIIFFGSAGNDPVPDPVYPAAYSTVSGVTAGSNGRLEMFANRYPGNDMMMPGRTLGQFKGTVFVVSGTSSSAAIASGIAASLLERGKVTASKVQSMMHQDFPPATQ